MVTVALKSERPTPEIDEAKASRGKLKDDEEIEASGKADGTDGANGGTLTAASIDDDAHPVKRRSVLRGLVKTIRPHQWVKNLFVMAPMFFHKDLFGTGPSGDPMLNLKVAGKAIIGTAVFCLLAGAVYTINDLVDVDADRVHPVKRNRPIASRAVPEGLARVFAGLLVVLAFGIALAFLRVEASPPGSGPDRLNWAFAGVAALYFVENLAYSFKLKKVAFLDVGLIAFGFVLRVLAGGLATDTKVSGYMLACTAGIALFLGFGKRRHELEGEHAGKSRAALEAYSKISLTVALAITGLATEVTYLAYTIDKDTEAFFQTTYLWLTVPFTLFGIVRFLFLVSGRAGRGRKAESPTQEMLSDVPFVLNLVIWVIAVVAIVYRLRPG